MKRTALCALLTLVLPRLALGQEAPAWVQAEANRTVARILSSTISTVARALPCMEAANASSAGMIRERMHGLARDGAGLIGNRAEADQMLRLPSVAEDVARRELSVFTSRPALASECEARAAAAADSLRNYVTVMRALRP